MGSMWRGFLLEMFATWFLMMAIMGTAVDKRAPKGVFGFAIGGMLTACIYSIGRPTGGALNPWRAIAPAIGVGYVSQTKFWKEFWIYLLAPTCGAVLAAFMWKFMFAKSDSKDDKSIDVETELVVERDFETNLVEVEVGNPPMEDPEPIEVVPVVVPDFTAVERQPPVNNIKWKGHYYQDGDKHEMVLRHMILDNEGNVSGSGSDDAGEFTLEGTMTNGVLEFKKQYPEYFVNYSGMCKDDNPQLFQGNWEIPDNNTGEFEIECHIPKWKGYYKQGGEKKDMQLNLSISQDGVYGQGTDVNGFFVCRGEMKDNGEVLFRKQYLGKWFVDYYGQYKEGSDNHVKVKGHWSLQGETPEEFELKLD